MFLHRASSSLPSKQILEDFDFTEFWLLSTKLSWTLRGIFCCCCYFCCAISHHNYNSWIQQIFESTLHQALSIQRHMHPNVHWSTIYNGLDMETKPKCPSTKERIKKTWYVYLMEYSVQFSCSVVSNSLRPKDCSTPGLPAHHQLPEFTQTHVYWVGDAIQPSHRLFLPLVFHSIRVF